MASEERNNVVVIVGREIHAMADEAAPRQDLYRLHPERPVSIWSSVRRLLSANIRYRLSAVGLASLT